MEEETHEFMILEWWKPTQDTIIRSQQMKR